jgi:hypothetical protein
MVLSGELSMTSLLVVLPFDELPAVVLDEHAPSAAVRITAPATGKTAVELSNLLIILSFLSSKDRALPGACARLVSSSCPTSLWLRQHAGRRGLQPPAGGGADG